MKKLDEYLRLDEATKLLGVHENVIKQWEKKGKLTVRRHPFNKYRLYDKEEMMEILRKLEESK
jgi:DNA-binding transcriptional MerR regulator